jgi:transposase
VLNMPQIQDIRDMARDRSVASISRSLSVDEKTVRKYLKQDDFSPQPPDKIPRKSRLDAHKNLIDQWLQEDETRWYKQRHTGKRIYERLREESPGFDCSYNVVQRYVKEVRGAKQEQRANQELVWHPGEAQADFGEADFIERGEKIRKKYLTLSFPQSNNSFTQVFGGENAECVCQGLKDIFTYIGGVPRIIVFDNATGVGRRVGEVIREAKLFQRFRAHYGFSVRFCNPYAGYEKGNVENKIGYTRRNMFVPEPVFDDVEAFNCDLLDRHVVKAEELHYKKLLPIKELFGADEQALQTLPGKPFDVCRYEYVKTDGYGKIHIDARHHYSTRPEYGGRDVLVGIRAHTIDILDGDKQLVVQHTRQYGTTRSDTVDYRTSLAMLLKNAGAWPNSGIRELVPPLLKDVMDAQPRDELRVTLRTLHLLANRYSFETALEAVEEGIRINRATFCDTAVLAARITEYGLETAAEHGPDLNVYDAFLTGAAVTG